MVEGSDGTTETHRLRDFLGHFSAILAVGIFLWQANLEDGWLEAAFGPPSTVFWLLIAAWLSVSILALRRRQHWWVVATAPFAIYPIFMAAILFGACVQGNCI
jgi:hypothetical protein